MTNDLLDPMSYQSTRKLTTMRPLHLCNMLLYPAIILTAAERCRTLRNRHMVCPQLFPSYWAAYS